MRNGGMTDHAIPGRLAWPWSPIHIVAIDVTHHQPSRASPPCAAVGWTVHLVSVTAGRDITLWRSGWRSS